MELLLGRTLNLPAGAKVLDAGCGYSPVARTLHKEFDYDMVGIDLIKERLDNGQQLNQDQGISVQFTQGDYHRLPYADNSFDGLYTMETLVHAYDLDGVLSEFKRILKPGGSLVLFEYTIPKLDFVPQPARGLAERVIKNTGMASLPRFTHGSFPTILTGAGFEHAMSEDIRKNVYPSWYHLWKYALKLVAVDTIKHGFNLDRVPGSTWIWPAHKQLGYAVSRATKPTE